MDGTTPGRPAESEKRAKFRELAQARTNKAIEAIARIGNLSNRQIYEYDEAEVKKIIKAPRSRVGSGKQVRLATRATERRISPLTRVTRGNNERP